MKPRITWCLRHNGSATTKQNNASNSGEMANKIKTKQSRCRGSRKNVDKTKCYPLTLSVIKLFLLLPHFKSGSKRTFCMIWLFWHFYAPLWLLTLRISNRKCPSSPNIQWDISEGPPYEFWKNEKKIFFLDYSRYQNGQKNHS